MEEQRDSFISVEGLGLETLESGVYKEVSLKANKGEVIALLGSEGSGKTSLLLTLGGRMKFSEGTAQVAGFDLSKNYPKVRDISGITLIEHVNDVLEFLTTRDILAADLALNCKPDSKEAVDAYLEEWGFMESAAKRFCDLDTNERNEFDLMLACTNDPELLLVDKIGQGMTHRRTLRLIESLRVMAKKRDMCIIFGTYEYDLAMAADGVVVMSDDTEEQRLRVIKDRGEDAMCAVVGSANGVHPSQYLKSSPAKKKLDKSYMDIPAEHMSDLFTGEALRAWDSKSKEVL